MPSPPDIGLIGLGVMGRNLALNLADNGYRVAVYNIEPQISNEFVATTVNHDQPPLGCTTLADLVATLTPPRVVLLMITAGDPVDQQLDALRPLLTTGDMVIDGGNSHYLDSQRRYRLFQADGLHYLGMGVSGGETGARYGPALMVGGSQRGYIRVAKLLDAIAAKVDQQACCAYLGQEGAGHFVKMVHNGIEYADMQLLAEAYALMQAAGLSYGEMQTQVVAWNPTELGGYLTEITADILATRDTDTDQPLVELILDRAGQKGTGRWTASAALELGVAAPTLIEAVCARALSAMKEQRIIAAKQLAGATLKPADTDWLAALANALLAAKACVYAQGFALLQAGAESYDWALPLARVAAIWRGGCIIRGKLLEPIRAAFERDPRLANLLLDGHFRELLARTQQDLRRTVAAAAEMGVSIPALSSALAYFDGYRSARLPANLIQAQRDYFGAHRYERVDRPGTFHTDWTKVISKKEHTR